MEFRHCCTSCLWIRAIRQGAKKCDRDQEANNARTIQWKRTSYGDEKSTLLYPDYELHAHRQRGLLDSRGWSHVLTESASNLPTDLAREDIHLVNVTNRRAT